MDTDEYEISLLRELEVCNKYIHSLQGFLREMENKYNVVTKEFVKGYCSGAFLFDNGNFAAWFKTWKALKKWEERKEEYEKVYRFMRI